MKKKIMSVVLGMAICVGQVNANQAVSNALSGIAGNVLGETFSSLDEQFGGLLSTALSYAEACFGFKPQKTTYDPCEMLDILDFKGGVCNGKISYDIGGFKELCQAKTAEFSRYISSQASAAVDYAFGDMKFSDKYASGIAPNSLNLKMDVNKILNDKSATNNAGNYLKDGKMQEYLLIWEYMKSAGAKNKEPNKITIDEVVNGSVPENMEAYDKSNKEAIKNQNNIFKSAMPNNIALQAKGKKVNPVTEESLAIIYQKAIETDLINTFGTNTHRKIAVPTKEYVNRLTPDLRLAAVAQIRKQQAFEVATISRITDKWEKKKAQARLLADKEVIMAQTFDRSVAKREIEQIANGTN